MDYRIRLACIIASVFFFGLVLELIRRRRLREGYSFVWIAASLFLLSVSIWNRLLFALARWFGVADGNSLLFAAAFLFLAIVLLHISVELTRLRRETKDLAQFLALTDWRARKVSGKSVESCPGGPSEAEPSSPSPLADG